MLTFANFLSSNARTTYERIAAYVGQRLGEPAQLLSGVEWSEQHRLLDAGEIQAAFICGLPYSQKRDSGVPLRLVAAPVMLPERYGGKPVYFTDVVVRADSPPRTFADLRGQVYVFNGRDSNSGYNIPRDYLLRLGETSGYFGRVVESGAHLRSLQLVLDGEADAAGIDSLVLDMEIKLRPELASQIRIVESIGPNPIPPVVAHDSLPPPTLARLRQALLTMHAEPQGKAILRDGLIARFVPVEDAYYDAVREMARRAHAAGFLELK